MRPSPIILAVAVLIAIPLTVDAFAESTYDVLIPTGAASPVAPYFWQSEKDGATTGIVEILIGDTIAWKNADTTAHTVTSGSAAKGPDNVYDSGLLDPGKSFYYTFTKVGNHPYFCTLYPWMEGTIVVTTGYSIIPNVGKQVGDDFFDVEYKFNRLLSISVIDVDQKSITFELVGNAKSDDHNLEIRFDSQLIDGPFVIWADGQKITDFEQTRDGIYNILYIPLKADSKTLTIVGTSIIPEFGQITMMILGISVLAMLSLSKKFKVRI